MKYLVLSITLRISVPVAVLALLCAGVPTVRADSPATEPVTYREARREFQRVESLYRDAHTPARTELSGSLEDYLSHAEAHNPTLRAAFYAWKSALYEVPQARSLTDPTVTYTESLQEVETRVGPQEERYGVSQKLPFPGKLRTKGAVALEAAHEKYQLYQIERIRLYRDVKAAYYELAYLVKATRIADENLKLLENFERVAQTKFRAATASNQDLLKAQVELGKLANDVITLEDLKPALVARLNALLDRPADAPLPEPTSLPRTHITEPLDQLLTTAQESSPDLKALNHRVAGAERNVRLARLDYLPDVTLGYSRITTGDSLTGATGSGTDAEMATVTVNVPIWYQRLNAQLTEAQAEEQRALEQRQARARTLEQESEYLLYQYRDAERQVQLYEHALIPKARQSLEAAETAYEGGETDFLNLIDSQRVLLAFQLAYYRAVANSEQRLADLEVLVGSALGDVTP